MTRSLPTVLLRAGLLPARFVPGAFLLAAPLLGGVCLPAAASADPSFRIVESVPEATSYGEPGIERTQAAWLRMIGGATRSIDIAAFYITDKPGQAMAPVMDRLIERARAGVRIRLLVERSFMRETAPSIERLRGVPNLEIAILETGALTGGVLHAKYMIVDAQRVFVGSQNWDWRALTQIHEIGAEIDDTRFAASFEAAFSEIWLLGHGAALPAAQKAAMLPAGFRPATEADPVLLDGALIAYPAFSPPALMPSFLTQEQPALLHMIAAARHSLRIQVMTLSAFKGYGAKGWWPELDSALRDAAARGVQVRIVVANWALAEPMQSYLKSLAVMPNIVVRFSTVPELPSGHIPYARVEHCKYAVADDDAVYIGTGNWEWSYFANTVDASVFVHGAGPAATLTAIFDRDWNGSDVTTVSPGIQYTPPHNR